MLKLYFNNKCSWDDFNLGILDGFELPQPREILEVTTVAGRRSGSILSRTGEFSDLTLNLTFRLIYSDFLEDRLRAIANWLSNIDDNKLWFDNDTRCYKVKKANIATVTTGKVYELGIEFLLEPFVYLTNEREEVIQNGENVYNEGDFEAFPVITLDIPDMTDVIFYVNDEEIFSLKDIRGVITINSNNYEILDIWKGSKSYHMKGDFPKLRQGLNKLSWIGEIREFKMLKNSCFRR